MMIMIMKKMSSCALRAMLESHEAAWPTLAIGEYKNTSNPRSMCDAVTIHTSGLMRISFSRPRGGCAPVLDLLVGEFCQQSCEQLHHEMVLKARLLGPSGWSALGSRVGTWAKLALERATGWSALPWESD